MTSEPLSSIVRVDDLRLVWPNEAADFTPWLERNLAALGEALGLDLEFSEREAPVGGYSLDIRAREPRENRQVVIENQLEKTDHDHLGKLLTYAAGYDAGVVVWLSREFTDEHRDALDWLNQRTGEDTLFFGVVVELWKIDNSRPAPHFNLVAQPNNWRKERVTRRAAASVSERGERYREFFQGLIDTLREEHKFTSAKKALPQNWHDFAGGRTGITYSAGWGRRGAGTELYIDLPGGAAANLDLLEQLEENKEEIEEKVGQSLDWQRLENRRACRIAATRPGSIDDPPETLAEIREWMVDRLLRFKEAFGLRISEALDG